MRQSTNYLKLPLPEKMSPRRDQVFIVVTILKTKNTYELKMKKPALGPNQFAYRVEINVDPSEWFNRIADVSMPKVSPPEAYKIDVVGADIGKSNAENVMDRLTGRK